MTSFFNLRLDTLAPQNVSLQINAGANYTTSAAVTLTVGTSDADKTGYSMKIWGIAGAVTEQDAAWEAFTASRAATLQPGDGLKTVYVKVRDAVWNESAAVTAQITLDSTVPQVSITGPDVSAISKVVGKNTSAFSFVVDKPFVAYAVKVVPASTSLQDAGTQISDINGSTNMSGTGTFTANTAINSSITGADLDAASSGDGTKIIKVFAKDALGNWSVA